MRLSQKSAPGWLFLLGWLAISPSFAQQGTNAIHVGNSNVASVAFVDATQYAGGSQDICAVIAYVLSSSGFYGNNSNGVVVDARGFTGTLSCSVNPFHNLFTSFPTELVSSTVLLPANTIPIQTTWVLPTDTRIVGEGSGVTVLQPTSNFGGTGDMIDMGYSPGTLVDATGVVIEHLRLNGGGQDINGIVNELSQELSYVNDVTITNLGGTGLTLGTDPPDCPSSNDNCGFLGAAGDSGPYSNIYYSGSGTCLSILAVSTRGVHGLTCAMTGLSAPAIVLDGPNNSLEDVTITNQSTSPSGDGILVGPMAGSGYSYTFAHANVLMNVAGTNLTNVVHISSHASSNSDCPPGVSTTNPTVNDVCDVTILGISGSSIGSATIQDDLSSTTLTNPTVAMYVVGEQMFGGTNPGNSRFTTSTSVPTWLMGGGSPAPSSCSVAGSLYSCTGVGGTCADTIYGCAGGSWTKILQ
jgi:hypothetical protein